jgi:hypothetical protein
VPSTRPLIDKLGVKPGAKVAIVNLDDPYLVKLLRERTDDVTNGKPDGPCDLVFLGVAKRSELSRIKQVKAWIEPDGAIWVVRPKGGRSDVGDTDVIDAGLAAGLVDNKIASFSDTQGAMRLVFRIKDRPQRPRRSAS